MTTPSPEWTKEEREQLISSLAEHIRTEIRQTHPNLASLDAWAEAVMLVIEKSSPWLENNREHVLTLVSGAQPKQ